MKGLKFKRPPNWEQKLVSRIEQSRGQPFKWGDHDCATFAASIIEELGGPPGLNGFVSGRYKSGKDFANLMGTFKGGMKGVCEEAMKDFRQISINAAKRGDVVLLKKDGRFALGVSYNDKIGVLDEGGLHFVGKEFAVITWAIGHN